MKRNYLIFLIIFILMFAAIQYIYSEEVENSEIPLMEVDNSMIGDIDFYSPFGIAILTVLLINFFIKPGLKKYLSEKWSKFLLVISVFVIAQLFSGLILFIDVIPNNSLYLMFISGCKSWFLAISGYEGIKRILNIFMK